VSSLTLLNRGHWKLHLTNRFCQAFMKGSTTPCPIFISLDSKRIWRGNQTTIRHLRYGIRYLRFAQFILIEDITEF
jgi:hypothetical protein